MADVVKKSIKDEMNSTVSCIPAKWNRYTVADGDWMQAKTLDQLMNRDDFLADKIGEGNSGWKDALSSESATRYYDDQYLSASISSLSVEFYTFSANDYYPTVTALRYNLNSEIDRATLAENNLSGRISIEETARSAADAKLQKQIDELQAATDVIAVFGTYDEFVAGSGDLGVTDNDTIKVLRDYNYTPSASDEDYKSNDDDGFQVYYEWHDPNAENPHTDWIGWSAIGSLDPYYSVSEIDEYKNQIVSDFDSLSSTVANNYLSANKNAVSAGKNILIDYEQNKPKITINTKEDVEFNNVSSKTVSSTNVTALTAQGNSAKFTNLSATNLNNIAISNLFGSAYSGAAASAWINSKNSTIAFTTNFKGSNNVITGYGTSSFSAGESNIYVRKDELECEIGSANSAIKQSFAQGKSNSANENSFVQGNSNTAGDDSFAQGDSNSANIRALAQGYSNTAYYESFAQGQINRVSNYSIGQGQGNSATNCSIAQGLHNNASNTAQAFGDNLVIESAMAIGKFNKTSSDAVFVIGNGTADNARNDLMVVDNSAAITLINYPYNDNQVDKIIISTTGVSGMYDHRHGGVGGTGEYSSEWSNICNIENKYVPLSALKCDIGSNNSASNDELVFMQGMSNYASNNSLTQGSNNSAMYNSLAQGYRNLASSNSIAIGNNNTAYANSQSFGQEAYASAGGIAINPHYWGSTSPTKAINNSFAMGKECVATSDSLAFGQNNTASDWSIAFGQNNTASNFSVAFGLGISANDNQYIYGKYPSIGSNTVFAIGNGSADNDRSNYVSINKYGTLNLKNTVNNTNKSVIINGHDRYIRSEENCRNIPFLLTSGYGLTSTITESLVSTPEINTETLLLYGNDSDYLNMWVPTGTSGNKFKIMKVASSGTYKISIGIQAGYDMIFKNFSSGTTLASRKKIQTDNIKTSWPTPQQGTNISTSAKSFYFPAEANTTCVQFTEIPGHDDIDVIVDSLGQHFIMIKNHSEV